MFEIKELRKIFVAKRDEITGEWRKLHNAEGPLNQINSPRLLVGAAGILSDFLRSVQMLKREWGAESIGKLPHIFNPW